MTTAGIASAKRPPPKSDTTAPSTPAGLTASNLTQASITLTWSASSDNIAVSGYTVYRNGGSVATTGTTGYTVSGLACNTPYTLAVDAYDAAGNHSGQASITATTTACSDSSPPSTPAGLAASNLTQTSITLTWSASSDNIAVSGYTVYRNGGSVATTGTTGYTVSGLACNTPYTLAVDAYDAAGNHSGQASITATTTACSDSSPPSTPAGLAASNLTQTSITLTWSASSDNIAVSGYTVYRNGGSVATTGTTGYTVSGLACNTPYTLAVDAYDAAGNHSGQASITATTTACSDSSPPSTPAGLAASNLTQTSITLTWSASSDNIAVSGYTVYRNGGSVATTGTTGYTVSGLACNTPYTLAVDAYDAAGNHSGQASITATTTACSDSSPPSTPAGLAASNLTQTSITLTWSASSDNIAVSGYTVYRSGVQIGTTTSRIYAFTGLSCATSSTLGVSAYDAAGNVSAVASVTRQTAQCQGQAAVSGFVQRSGKTLVLNGSVYKFTGLNAYFANSLGRCGPSVDLGSSLDSWGAGKEVLRSWFFQSLATSNGTRDWTAFDQTLATARAHGYRMIVTLANQWPECDGGYGYKTDTWYRSGYRDPDPSGTLSYRDYVAEIVSRYKDDPTILMWQLMNEAEDRTAAGSCPTDATQVLKTWATDVSGLIKSIDPNHLVSLGTMGGGTCGAAYTQYQSIHDVPTIDVCEVHDYGWPAVPLPGDQWNGLQAEIKFCGNLNKPIFVGENGISTEDISAQERAADFSAKLTAQFGAGVVGELAWTWSPFDSIGYNVGPGDPSLDVIGV